MKRIGFLVAMILILGSFSVFAVPSHKAIAHSLTRVFSLDGRYFAVGMPSGDGLIITRKLRDLGIDMSAFSNDFPSSEDSIVESLTELPNRNVHLPIPLAITLQEDHVLRTKTESGMIDIACGKIKRGNNFMKNSIVAGTWRTSSIPSPKGIIHLATLTEGKETSLVLLEEKEGTCLYIRQLEK